MEKRNIDFKTDIGLIEDGEPFDLVYLNFEPVPLSPTYSFIFEGKELRYNLLRLNEEDIKNGHIYKLVLQGSIYDKPTTIPTR